MSDIKNYYYIRLVDSFYERNEIKIIEKIENGYEYVTILLKMYLKSLKNDGALIYSEGIPYDIDMLNSVLGHDKVKIEKAIELFQKFKLLDVMDDGTMYMTKIQSFIGQTTTEADRKREYRKKIDTHKAMGHLSGHLSDVRPPELRVKSSEIRVKSLNLAGDGTNVPDALAVAPQPRPVAEEGSDVPSRLPDAIACECAILTAFETYGLTLPRSHSDPWSRAGITVWADARPNLTASDITRVFEDGIKTGYCTPNVLRAKLEGVAAQKNRLRKTTTDEDWGRYAAQQKKKKRSVI